MSTCEILATYSPKDVTVIISGTRDNITHIISGTIDGTFININRVVPYSEMYNGADGSNVRVIRDIKNHEVTLTLHQGSESNDVLSQLFFLDTQNRRNEYVFEITIKDTGGRTLAFGKNAMIGSPPDVDFGTEVAERPWQIFVTCMDFFVGGNARFSNDAVNTLTQLGMDVEDQWQPLG